MGFWSKVGGGFAGIVDPLGMTGAADYFANQPLEDAADNLAAIEVPDPETLRIQLEEYVQQGKLRPEDIPVIEQRATELRTIKSDPRLREAQMRALKGLEDIASTGGMTTADKARLSEIQRSNATAERGSREAILQRAAERGVGGSGLELAAQLEASQSAADRNAQEGDRVAIEAEKRALDALMRSGDLGGSIRGQDFGEQERIAEAQDAINRFNTANRQGVYTTNTAERNRAQQYNLGEKQRVADINTQQENDNRRRNSDLIQQQFNNRMAKATGQVAPLTNLANQYANQNAQRAQTTSSLIGSGAMLLSDERKKEDIESGVPDLNEFMKHLTVNKFEYKDPEKFGSGKHYGPMAQDLERSPVGKSMVEEDEEGTKHIDYGKASAIMLSVLKDLHGRVQNLEHAT